MTQADGRINAAENHLSSERIGDDGRLIRCIEWYKGWEEATHEARLEATLDRDYYDNKQWRSDEEADLDDRGQPIVTTNKMGPMLDFLLGVEATTVRSPRAYPRTPAHADDASIAEDALAFAADETEWDYKRSYTAKHQVIEGIGGHIHGVIEQVVNGSRRVILTIDELEWDRIWYDPHSRKPDFSDAQYLGIVVWRHLDDLYDDPMYSGKRDVIEAAKGNFADAQLSFLGDTADDAPRRWFDSKTSRMQIFECYWTEWDKAGGRTIWGAHFNRADWLIKPFPVPFRDDRGRPFNPMELVSGYVDRDGNRYGAGRRLRSPQDERNKRRSKMMHHLSTKQVMYEDQAIDDIEEFMEEVAKPDGKLRVNRNAIAEGRVQILDGSALAMGQFQAYQATGADMDEIGFGGPGDAPASSAREFSERREVGTLKMRPIFQHLERYDWRSQRKVWWLIRQNWTEDMWLRVRDDEENEGYRFVRINQQMTKGMRVLDLMDKGHTPQKAISLVFGPGPARVYDQVLQMATQRLQQEAQQGFEVTDDPADIALRSLMKAPQAKDPFTEHDVAQLDVDIRLEVVDASPSVQAAQHERLLEFLHRMATAGKQIPDSWIEMVIMSSPLANRRQLIAKLKEPPPPEVVQQQQQQQQAAMQEMAARIAKLEAEAELKKAQADKAGAQAEAVVIEAGKAQAATAKLIVETEAIEEGALKPSRGIGNDSALQ